MGVALVSIRIVLAAVFALAAVGKLIDLAGSRRAMEEFGLPSGPARVAGVGLPALELAVAAGLLIDATARYAAALGLVLLLAFIAGIVRVTSQGRAPDCHCFGQLHSEPAGPSAIVRNVLLAALAGTVVVAGAGAAIPGGLAHLDGAQVALAVVVAVAILLALATATLWGERRRLRGELEVALAAGQRPGLPRGALAPDFELLPVRGTAASLSDLMSSDRAAVLVFVSTTCPACVQLLPVLARWQQSLAGTVTLATVFSGGPWEIQRLSEQHGLSTVLAEEVGETTLELYRLRATPSAVMVVDGRIDGGPAEGAPAIESMIRAAIRRTDRNRRAPDPMATPPGMVAVLQVSQAHHE
jgi:uncharacterized membrane protein YphA (DoxX/SURF4 family)/thiol-disulfide isomerase/thioredoxin